MLVICGYCDKEFNKRPSLVKDINFCSNECYKNHVNKNKNKDSKKRVCKCCGVVFYMKSNTSGLYCSRECYNKDNKDTLIERIPKKELKCYGKCLTCNSDMFGSKYKNHKGYCSMDCYLIAMRSKKNISEDEIVQLHKDGLYDREIAEIAGCSRENITYILMRRGNISHNRKSKIDNMELRVRISKSVNKVCLRGKNHPSYKGLRTYSTIGRKVFKNISREVMFERDFICECCGIHGNGIEFHVHHIKYFRDIIKQFLTENPNYPIDDFENAIKSYKDFIDKSNLVLLCKDCHRDIHKIKDNHEPS